MKKVTGIGGIFFKCDDPSKLNEWYAQHLGIPAAAWGAMFEWREKDHPDRTAYTVWSTKPADTQYFEPSRKDFMINYRVENLDELVEELKNAGVTIVDEIAVYESGKFVHILDPEDNIIELFEPAADPQ